MSLYRRGIEQIYDCFVTMQYEGMDDYIEFPLDLLRLSVSMPQYIYYNNNQLLTVKEDYITIPSYKINNINDLYCDMVRLIVNVVKKGKKKQSQTPKLVQINDLKIYINKPENLVHILFKDGKHGLVVLSHNSIYFANDNNFQPDIKISIDNKIIADLL